MGKIGLPLATQIATKGFEVVGLELNEDLVNQINGGICPYPEEFGLEEKLKGVINNGKLKVTLDLEFAVENSQVILFAIPLLTNSDNKPDFENYDRLIKTMASKISPETLLLFETTLPIGTTRTRFLEQIKIESDLIPGQNIFAAYSPERVTTGRVFADLRKYPKIVGGLEEVSARKAKDFYEKILDFDNRLDLEKANGVWVVESLEAAEFVKLAETTYRDVNIGLANQFAIHALRHGISFDEVRSCANSQPYSNLHEPGIAVGGHCIPVYPHFYTYTDESASIVKSARDVNSKMPNFFVAEIENRLGSLKNFKILILGISYRENVKETAYSGSLAILKILKSKGALVYAEDLQFDKKELESLGFKAKYERADVDIIVVQTKDRNFLSIDYSEFVNLKLVADGRSFLRNSVLDLNIDYFSLG
jgi:nucleotide sugar dehydrogenase